MSYMKRAAEAAVEKIGTFEVTCGKVRVSDPCYTPDTTNDAVLPALNGRWNAYIETGDCGFGDVRCARLFAFHEDHDKANLGQALAASASVDSGQCGIYDDESYKKNQGGEYGDTTTFYGKVCELTNPLTHALNRKTPAGIIDGFGVVSSSGLGDGSYEISYATKDGLPIGGLSDVVVGVGIDYLPEEDEEDEEPMSDEEAHEAGCCGMGCELCEEEGFG